MVRPPYPTVLRLCSYAAVKWPEIEASYYQINLFKEKPSRFIRLVYAWFLQRIDPEKRDEFDMELAEMMPWQSTDTDAAIDIESESFAAFMNSSGGGRG